MNLSWLLPSGKGIPVLMYHKVWPGISDSLTINPEDLRTQWEYLRTEGYQPLSLPDYLDIVTGKKLVSGKPLLLTFDDGYLNNLTYVYPLLLEFGWSATFFIITGMLDGTMSNDSGGPAQMMSAEDLRQLDPAVVQLAMHGYLHENMSKITNAEILDALHQSIRAFTNSGLQWHKVLAYPYGARPVGDFSSVKKAISVMGISAAFRIGNKVSEVPATDLYELKRIDIKGTDSLADFRVKLKKGKLKPF